MNESISKLFIHLSKRAEKADPQTLIESFVDVGPLGASLTTIDNQIVYGRRGTGKTHALIYVSGIVRSQGDVPVYVDLRNVGSTGGLYADPSVPLAERATRLLMDVLAAVHGTLLEAVLDDHFGLNLAQVGPALDDFAASITEVTVSGSIKEELASESTANESSKADVKIGASAKGLESSMSFGDSSGSSVREGRTLTREGNVIHRVHFGKLGAALQKLSSTISGKRIWLLLDEWSVVPVDLQPYLADLLRRAVFPSKAVSVKIGAIERRSRFQLHLANGDYIGIELGGDASADLNMDDFMVFDNDDERAIAFFKTLVFNHINALARDHGVPIPADAAGLVRDTFTQETVFKDLVRAAEGIPRDAFYILSAAAQMEFGKPISMTTIRKCSKEWYTRDKEAAVSANSQALELLHWIIDEVIAHRKARAFLLKRGVTHELIDNLFDWRVLHLRKRNISAHDQPGVRYDVYAIDYGCYVDLLSTARAPSGLLNQDDGTFVLVPPDDYRAIRRAILDIDEFLKAPPTRPALKMEFRDASTATHPPTKPTAQDEFRLFPEGL